MHHAQSAGVAGDRITVSIVLGCLMAVAWSAAASAQCGAAPGDATAVAAVRSAINKRCPCASATDRGSYVRCVKGVINQAKRDGMLSLACVSSVKKCATRSTCGRPDSVVCCRTDASGTKKCTVKKSAAQCRAPVGGAAHVGNCPSCCDACSGGTCGGVPTPTDSQTVTPTPTPTTTPTPTITPTPTLPAICQAVVGLPPIGKVPVTLQQGSTQCGGAMLANPPPAPPFSGSVDDGSSDLLGNLSLGCLYAGGLPALLLPYGSSTEVSVVGLQAVPLALTLGPSAGSGPSDCTMGAGPGRSCANGAPGIDGSGTCHFDSDCGGTKTACALDANCYFGPPIPVPNGPLSACVLNVFQQDLCGQVTLVPPVATLAAALSSRVYLTLDADSPCPLCQGGVCTAGDRAGMACTPVGSAGTSPDCPPSASRFLSILNVVIPALTSGESTLTAADGLFCAGQSMPGAMGLAAARSVSEQGSGPTLPLLSTDLSMSVAGTFCIEPTGTFLDAVAGLPAVGALATGASVDLTSVLP
jgi:hypothetical protein